MRQRNDWTVEYLPNAAGAPELPVGVKQVERQPALQRVLEALFDRFLGDRFEKWERRRKVHKLTREQSSSVESYFSADVCKGHIDGHGEHVVTALAVRLKKAAEKRATETA
jgi:hypothetical protein